MTQLLSVVGYNLKDYGKSATTTRREQHDMLRFLRADVLLLQEIWDEGDDLTALERHLATLTEALGMRGMAVPARRTHCHMAILWRPEFAALAQQTHTLTLWHGLGVVRLDIGARVPLRVAVTHLAPWSPEQRLSDAHAVAGLLDDPAHATIVAADMNSLGADTAYDPEPQWDRLRPGKIWRHVPWSDDPTTPPLADRRPAQLLHRSGLSDAAVHLNASWQPTGGHLDPQDIPRRVDAIWTTRPAALRGYQVHDTPTTRRLSDHLPIMAQIDPEAL